MAEIGVKLGGVRETAKPWVARAKKLKLVSQVGSRRGSANGFKVVARRGASQWGGLATGLARLDATDPVMAVVGLVEHPMISYGMKNGHRMWALLLARALEVEPARTGLSVRSVSLAQKDIDRLELQGLSGAGLLARLDQLAQVADPISGLSPALLAHRAEAFRKARAEERKHAVYEARTQARADWAAELKLRKETKAFDDDEVQTGPLPQGFDPDQHMGRLKEALAQKGLILVRTDRKQWFASPDLFGSPGPAPEWSIGSPEPETRTVTIALPAGYEDQHEVQLRKQVGAKLGRTVTKIVVQPDGATAVVHLSA